MADVEKSDPGKKEEFITALNNAALLFQQSKHSKESVLTAVSDQISKLGMRGGIGFLDETGKKIKFSAIAQPPNTQRLFRRLGKIVGVESLGFGINFEDVAAYNTVITGNQVVYVENTQEILLKVLPEVARNFSRLILKYFPPSPGIYAPLLSDN